MNKKVICRLEDLGVSLFRINLSHENLENLEEDISFIQEYSKVPICLDTEGAQIRSGFLSSKRKFLTENEQINIGIEEKLKPRYCFPLYPHYVLNNLVEGSLLSIDFDRALIQITSVKKGKIEAKVISSGWVGSNKAVSTFRPVHLRTFTKKDKKAIAIGKKLGIKHFALSFTNCGEDIRSLKKLVGRESHIIAKIESKKGYGNLSGILREADAIIIDRGDLSREVTVETIPFYQREIIKQANHAKKPVYVATNIFESMNEKPYPTRAEVSDVINILMTGADGLVLAAETAIGTHPIESATMVAKLIRQFHLSQNIDVTKNSIDIASTLVEPHGGRLIQRWDREPCWDSIRRLERLKVSESVIMDCEQIGIGTYSPLEGFMTREQLRSVLNFYRLPNGLVWTLPIVLQKNKENIKGFKTGQTIALVNEADGEIYATLRIKDIYCFPFKKICEKWFGTSDPGHPGVYRLKTSGDCFLGGEIVLLRRRNPTCGKYEFTPAELRHIFDNKGWNRVVGFHTRNVIHKGHEEIQKIALEAAHCDGLLISPAIGEKKKGDFSPKVILDTYQLMIDKEFFPKNKVFIGAFSARSRYSGSREAVFTAICRKNFGCTHFIVGRDHTGTGNFYAPYDAQKLFKIIGNIGITPIFFNEIYFCPFCKKHVFECAHDPSLMYRISGTQVRGYLMKQKNPPSWLMRKDISKMILGCIKQGEKVFVS